MALSKSLPVSEPVEGGWMDRQPPLTLFLPMGVMRFYIQCREELGRGGVTKSEALRCLPLSPRNQHLNSKNRGPRTSSLRDTPPAPRPSPRGLGGPATDQAQLSICIPHPLGALPSMASHGVAMTTETRTKETGHTSTGQQLQGCPRER